MKNIGILYDYIEEPISAVNNIIETKPLSLTFLILFFSGASQVLGNLIFLGVPLHWSFLTILVFVRFLVGVLLILLLSSIIHITAEIFDGKASLVSLFTLLSFSFIPLFFLLPMSIISNSAGKFSYIIYPSTVIVVIFFIFKKFIFSIKNLYGFSTGKAFYTLLTPFFLIFLFVIILSVMIIIGFFAIWK